MERSKSNDKAEVEEQQQEVQAKTCAEKLSLVLAQGLYALSSVWMSSRPSHPLPAHLRKAALASFHSLEAGDTEDVKKEWLIPTSVSWNGWKLYETALALSLAAQSQIRLSAMYVNGPDDELKRLAHQRNKKDGLRLRASDKDKDDLPRDCMLFLFELLHRRVEERSRSCRRRPRRRGHPSSDGAEEEMRRRLKVQVLVDSVTCGRLPLFVRAFPLFHWRAVQTSLANNSLFHCKYWLFDNDVALVWGGNLGGDYLAPDILVEMGCIVRMPPPRPPSLWDDATATSSSAAACITAELQALFQQEWHAARKTLHPSSAAAPCSCSGGGGCPVAAEQRRPVQFSGRYLHKAAGRQGLIPATLYEAIAHAKEEIFVASGFFTLNPTSELFMLLMAALRRGVRVRLCIGLIMYSAPTLHHLLQAGATAVRLRAGRLHNKYLRCDKARWIGSANMTGRSLFLDEEMLLRVDSLAYLENGLDEYEDWLSDPTSTQPILSAYGELLPRDVNDTSRSGGSSSKCECDSSLDQLLSCAGSCLPERTLDSVDLFLM